MLSEIKCLSDLFEPHETTSSFSDYVVQIENMHVFS